MSRQLKFKEAARDALLRGMEAVADAVGATLGPRGQTVVLSRQFGPALVTKDGVTVAKNISLPDPWENEGAKLIQEVAQKTNTEAGDGTTAATILTRAIFREGIRQITAGADPQSIERGIRQAVDCVVQSLKDLATPISQQDLAEITAIATISANGDQELGGVIAQAIHQAGLEGNFNLDMSPTTETTLQISQGLEFDRGLISPVFMTERSRATAIYENCNVLVTDKLLVDMKQIGAFFEKTYVPKARAIPLLIIAADVAEGALQLLAANHERGNIKVCPVKAPGSGEGKSQQLEDIAIYTGARLISKQTGDKIEDVTMDDIGSAAKVIVTRYRTTIVGGAGTATRIEARKAELREGIADPQIKDFDKAMIERRLAALSASIAVIRIGSNVHSKLLERRDRAEDSLNATLAALSEGIVPGGGVALIRCLPALKELIATMSGDEKTGAQVIANALTAPLHRLATNAGVSGDVVVGKVSSCSTLDKDFNRSYGYNAATGTYEDLVKAGVIDPKKVVRLALQNSAELAGLLLTSAALVVDLPEPQNPSPANYPQPSLRG